MTERTLREKIAALITEDHLQLLSDFDVDGDIYRQDPECVGSAYMMADAILALLDAHTAAQPAPTDDAAHCEYCDGTGDAHRIDGEWLGTCDCALARANRTAAQPAPDAVAEAGRAVVAAWRKSAPMMTADYHGDNCDCLRCAMGDLEHTLAKDPRT